MTESETKETHRDKDRDTQRGLRDGQKQRKREDRVRQREADNETQADRGNRQHPANKHLLNVNHVL